MEKHDHPTVAPAARRFGGRPWRRGDADARRRGGDPVGGARRAVRLGRRARVGARGARRSPLVHPAARNGDGPASHSPKLDVEVRPVLFRRASSSGSDAGCRARHASRTSACSAPDTDPRGREVRIWNQPFEVVGVVASTNWATTGAVGDDQFDAVYVPLTTVHRLLNLTKLNSITITSRSAGETTRRVAQGDALFCGSGTGSPKPTRMTSSSALRRRWHSARA